MGDDDNIGYGVPTLYLGDKKLCNIKETELKVIGDKSEWHSPGKTEASFTVQFIGETREFLWGICKQEAQSYGEQLAQWIRYHPFEVRLPRKVKKAYKKAIAKRLADDYAILNDKHILKYIKGKRQ